MGNSKSKSGPQTLTDEDVNFLITNTDKSKEEVLDWYDKFMKSCPSGKVDKKQFGGMYKGLYPSGNSQKFSDHVFRSFDLDGNGYIDFREFMVAIYVTSQGSSEEKIRWVFSVRSVDHGN